MPQVSNKDLKGIVAVDENNNMVQITKANFERVFNNKFDEVNRIMEKNKGDLVTTIALVDVTAKDGVARAKAAQRTADGKQNAGNYIHHGDRISINNRSDSGGCGGGCKAIQGFKLAHKSQTDWPSGWNVADVKIGHATGAFMRIHRH